MFKVRIQSGPTGPVQQIWTSGTAQSGNSYAQSGHALIYISRHFICYFAMKYEV